MMLITSPNRHPELVSGSMVPSARQVGVAAWMLKQVQHDEEVLGRGVAHA